MNAPSREEIDAKLEATENRMDGRVIAIQAALNGFIALMDERARSADERSLGAEERARRADARMDRMESMILATQSAVSSLKTTIIITAVTAVLATVFGVAAFNATVLSNMLASFESGKNTAAAQAEVKKQADETGELLKQMRDEFEAYRAEKAGKK